jgi:hypothetical protein
MAELFIVRGLPGSGKTSLGHKLSLLVYSADDFFTDEKGQYNFDPSRLGEAHAACQLSVRKALEFECGKVAVTNTFTERWEIEPYLRIVAEVNENLAFQAVDREEEDEFEPIRVTVIDMFDGGLSDEELSSRNVHGVPAAGIAAMRSRYEFDWKSGNPVPPWERK